MDNNLILKRFFTKSMFHDLLSGKSEEIFQYIVERYVKEPDGKDYSTLISEVYAFMNKNYRTEYYYKNTMLNKLLLNKPHNLKTTVALSELPIGQSKADFVLINGHGIVYEIKTELDNMERLKAQIDDYYKAFLNVVVVTYPENIEKVRSLVNDNVGLAELTKRSAVNIVRMPQDVTNQLDYSAIFNILRKKEFENILKNNNIILPQVSQFLYYRECFRLLKGINIEKLQKQMLLQLKQRVYQETEKPYMQVQKELKSILYFDGSNFDYSGIDVLMSKTYGGDC